jgi:hypothetical protein
MQSKQRFSSTLPILPKVKQKCILIFSRKQYNGKPQSQTMVTTKDA